MNVTGHKAETSLKTYTGHTNNKKKNMSNIITKSTGAVPDINDSSEQAESAHKDIPDFTLESVTNSHYDDLMDDLNSDPEFDKILAEMLPNSGENIIPVATQRRSLQCIFVQLSVECWLSNISSTSYY